MTSDLLFSWLIEYPRDWLHPQPKLVILLWYSKLSFGIIFSALDQFCKLRRSLLWLLDRLHASLMSAIHELSREIYCAGLRIAQLHGMGSVCACCLGRPGCAGGESSFGSKVNGGSLALQRYLLRVVCRLLVSRGRV